MSQNKPEYLSGIESGIIRKIIRLVDMTFAENERYRRFRGGTWRYVEVRERPGYKIWTPKDLPKNDYFVLETKEYRGGFFGLFWARSK